MTDAEHTQALEELAALRASVLSAQRRIADSMMELLGILAILKGEADLMAARGRSMIDAYYEKYPELKAGP